MWKISVLIVLLLFPIKVLSIESDDTMMLLVDEPIEFSLIQYHSVSLTTVESILVANQDGIIVKSVIYMDQGGAGMPNPKDINHKDNFNGSTDISLPLPLRFASDNENYLQLETELISLESGASIDVKYTSLFNIIMDRIGVI